MITVLEQEVGIGNESSGWQESEQVIARHALDLAHHREVSALLDTVRHAAQDVQDVSTVWQIHDFLSARRHDLDGKYDFRLSGLIFVLARLVKEGWLEVGDLQGLAADKVAKVTSLSRMLP
jgi:hypothetical protein